MTDGPTDVYALVLVLSLRLLRFLTGASLLYDQPPTVIKVSFVSMPAGRLPEVSTCFYQLKIADNLNPEQVVAQLDLMLKSLQVDENSTMMFGHA